MDGFRSVTHEGWLARLGGAVKGLIAGLVLLVVSVGVQFWNEGRTVKRDAALGEGRSTVQASADARPAPPLEGRLVHAIGEASAAAPVADAEFGVQLPALALRRRVEMYQWRERREQREEKQIGGGTRKITEYRYEKDWDDEEIDSSRFEQRQGHDNPGALPYSSQTWRAERVTLGGYVLGPDVAGEIGGWDEVPTASLVLPPNLAASFRPSGSWLVTSAEPARPDIGDVRVRFEIVPAGVVSVVARQQGESLVTHTTSGGETLALVERGRHDAAALFDSAASANSTLAWILRGAGFALAWVAFSLLLKPLVVVADVLPVLGRVAGFGTGIVAGVLAALTSLMAIGGGWLWNRPWLLGLALAAIVALVVWALRGRRGAPAAAMPMASTPPPPPPPAS
jgi:hypothetical protein